MNKRVLADVHWYTPMSANSGSEHSSPSSRRGTVEEADEMKLFEDAFGDSLLPFPVQPRRNVFIEPNSGMRGEFIVVYIQLLSLCVKVRCYDR